MATTGPLLPVPAGRSSQSPFTVAVVRTHAMLLQATSRCFTPEHSIAAMDTHNRALQGCPRFARGRAAVGHEAQKAMNPCLVSSLSCRRSGGPAWRRLAIACDQKGPGKVSKLRAAASFGQLPGLAAGSEAARPRQPAKHAHGPSAKLQKQCSEQSNQGRGARAGGPGGRGGAPEAARRPDGHYKHAGALSRFPKDRPGMPEGPGEDAARMLRGHQ